MICYAAVNKSVVRQTHVYRKACNCVAICGETPRDGNWLGQHTIMIF